MKGRLGEAWAEVTKPSDDLRAYIYQVLCFIGVATAVSVIVVNWLQRIAPVVNVAVLFFGIGCGLLFWAARRGRHHVAILQAMVVATLDVVWFANGGSEGSATLFFFAPALYTVILCQGRARWASLAVYWVNGTALLWLEHVCPSLAIPYASEQSRLIDLMVGYAAANVLCVAIMWVVLSAYNRERERLARAAAALRASEERLARTFQLNPDAAYIVDEDSGVCLEVNDGFEDLTGWSREDAVGREVAELGLWVDAERHRQMGEALRAEGGVHGYPAQHRARDGRLFWGETSAGPIEVDGKRCAIVTIRDVSMRVEAERALEESRALLSAVIDSTDDFVCCVDAQRFGLMVFNASMATHFRQQAGVELRLGMTPAEVVGPEAAEDWHTNYAQALKGGPFLLVTTPPGTDETVLFSFNLVRHEGEVTGISVFARNITELKRVQDERQRVEVELMQAQKMESLGSLAGGVAHDFNNMLAAIMGHADLLLRKESDPGRREHLDAILAAAARAGDLTGKLLAFGRRGRNIVEAVDLGTIARDGLALLQPSLSPHARVVLDVRHTYTVDGDPSQMSQVFLNLCINANDAMPEPGTLTVATRDVTLRGEEGRVLGLAPGDYVELRVSDTGVGMPPDVRARIFEPFFTTKTAGASPGTGLGLSTVHGIVQTHGGGIRVESAPGEGTTFTLFFPKGALGACARAETPRVRQGQGTVLVVEDEALVRRMAAMALGQLGYRVLEAEDGEAGARLFRQHHADLFAVLLDLKMPRKSGAEAFAEMRAIDASVPVLICSGYGDNEEAQHLITQGASGLLSKPYRVPDLASRLQGLRT